MGGKKATTTSSVSIPPEVLARYNAVNTRAETAATTPYEAFGKTASDYVAPLNARQGAGFNDINATAGSYLPYMTEATTATRAGLGPAYEGIDNYMSPYIKNVADTTGAFMRQQQEQAQSGALGNAISSGAFGGDRAGIAAANLQQQNQMAYGKTMADILNQGYTQALGASQADLARQLAGGEQLAGLGAQSQQLGLQGAQAKIAAGTMEQQTEQAGKDAMINQFMQEKGYPFQIAQFLANISMGTGAASGSTTSTTTPRNWMGFASGGAVDGYASGGVAGPRTYSQGTIGGEGYVPAGDLPVGQLMVAQPPDQGQSDKTGEIINLITKFMGAARGGAIDQRHGYALDGGVGPYTEMLRRDLRDREKRFAERPSLRDTTQGTDNSLNLGYLMRQPTNPANMGMGATSSFTSTPNHPYPTYPNAPTTGVTPPNEKFDPQVMADYNAAQLQRPTTGVAAPTTGSYSYPAQGTEELRRSMGARNGLEEGRRIIDGLNQDALMRAPTNPASMGLPGRPAPQMVAPTGVAPVSALEELNFSDPYNVAGTAAAVSGGVATPVVDAAPAPVPTPKAEPKSYFIDGQTWIRHPNGLVTDFLENPIDVNAARGILYQMDLQDRAEMNKSLAQSYDSLSQVHRDKLALSQRNKDALLGMYQGNFPVSARATEMSAGLRGAVPDVAPQPSPAPTGGVVPPAMTARPAGVQQPMAFTAGAMTSPAPAADLGTQLSTSGVNQAVPVVTSAVPAVDTNGVAGPKPELGAGIIVGNTMTAAPEGLGYDKDRLAAAIRFQESGSPSGNYGVLGAPVQRKDGSVDRAYGAYQVMGANIPQWTKEVLGYSMTPEEFLRDPQAQDTVAKAKLDQIYSQYGNIADVSSVWFSGRPIDKNHSVDPTSGKSVPSYVADVMNKYYNGGQGGATNYNRGSVDNGVPSFDGLGGADMTQQRGDPLHINKQYEDRNMIGKFFHDPTTGKLNPNAVMALLSGIGNAAQAQTISPLGGILAGIGAGSDTYKGLLKQQSDIALQQAQARRQGVISAGETGGPSVDISGGQVQPLLGEMGGNLITEPYQVPQGMEPIFSKPQVVQGLQMDNQMVYPNSSPQSIAAADLATTVQQNYTTAKNTFTPVMSSFGAAASLLSTPGAGGAGFGADLRANMFAATNMVLSSLGMGPISVSDLADKKAILQKVAAAAAAAGQGNNPSVQALMNALDTQGDAALPPEALASITAQNLVDRQMALEKGDFYQTWGRSQGIKSQTGNATYIGAEPTFSSELGQKYNAEKGFLEQIMLAPNQTKEQLDLREQLIHLSSGVAGGGFTPQAVQAAIKEAYPNAPDDLWKVFFNKGLAE
jgi:hypothetical protein